MNKHVVGSFYLTLASGAFLISSYITNIWLGRHLGPESYGRYGVIIAVWSAVNLILTAGIPHTVTRLVAADHDQSDRILKSALLIQLISVFLVTGLYVLFASTISTLLHDSLLVPYFLISALIIPGYTFFSLYVGFYNGKHAFKRQALLNISYSIIKVISVIGFAVFFGLSGAIFGFVLAPALAMLFGIRIPSRTTPFFPYKKLVHLAFPLTVFAVISTLQQNLDLFIVKSFVHAADAAGFYAAAQNISRIPFFGLSAFSLILFPGIARSISIGNKEKTKTLVIIAVRLLFLITIPLVAMISSTSLPLVRLLYAQPYEPAAQALSILAIGYGCLTIYSTLANMLNGADQTKYSVILGMIGLGVTVIISFIIVPLFGITGAAIAATVGCTIAMAGAAMVVHRSFQTFLPLASLIKIFFSGLVIFVLGRWIQVSPYLLIIEYIALLGIYLFCLFLTKELTINDLKEYKKLFNL